MAQIDGYAGKMLQVDLREKFCFEGENSATCKYLGIIGISISEKESWGDEHGKPGSGRRRCRSFC